MINEWIKTEEKINKIALFLRENIDQSPFSSNDPIKCSNCIFRKIAILILEKKIKIKKIYIKNNPIIEKNKILKHGSFWHNSFIENIDHFFIKNGYETEKEPCLFYGRADLLIPKLNLYIEVGTVNIYKLLCNLNKMNNYILHIIPSNNYLLEIKI